ncbi:MAG: folylpolyglutamate synthase/dihydrofolate synthase family protein [Bacteroidales bacterium]|jgi:dihydrofolate synthase/folylpolyglutamate synthase|nr:folylpolyglutamate synthase/dihydrofolate synthase family protein [Bacteroidales bacterium]
MNYRETLAFLFNSLPVYQRVGKAAYKEGLGNTLALDSYFSHPHTRYDTIHIAGTNGKGSVSHMMASVLATAGFRTGLYTSPHLVDFRERIRVNGVMIPENEVVQFVARHRGIIESVSPSFFEMTVAMAFDHFARMGVDVAVIETGMGGRLDSTNIITPVLSVITNIGHDHMEFLGDTLQKVAGEKAGIIKPGVPVVIGETNPETVGVFENAASRNASPISFADRNYSCRLSGYRSGMSSRGFIITRNDGGHTITGKTPLPGDYQSRNLVTLFQSLASVAGRYNLTEKQITDGVALTVSSTGLSGRWQVLGREPLVICDTAHNREGLEWVLRQLRRLKYHRLHIVLGFVSDKDLASVLPLFPEEAVYYFTRASVPRALDPEILRSEAGRYGLTGKAFPDVRSAMLAAGHSALPDDVIFVGGSTFVVAEAV